MHSSAIKIENPTPRICIFTGARELWLGLKDYLIGRIARFFAYPVLFFLAVLLKRIADDLADYFQGHIDNQGKDLSFNRRLELYQLLKEKRKIFQPLADINPGNYPWGFRKLGKSIQHLSLVVQDFIQFIDHDYSIDNHPESEIFTFSNPMNWDKKAESYTYLC
jgi:hypothetical protein